MSSVVESSLEEACPQNFERIINMRWCPQTQYAYKRCLIEFFAWMEGNERYSHMLTQERELSQAFDLNAFLDFCSQKKKVDKKTGESKGLSYSGLNRYRSALKFYLKQSNRLLTDAEEERLSGLFIGLKRICAREKQDGLRPVKEGKTEMPFDLYRALAGHFYRSGDTQSAAYLILTWNLCCRTNNTESIKMSHLGWHRDALRIVFGLTKSNQEAERDEWRLIFANPDDPVLCPITALSIYLVEKNCLYTPNSKLFLGGTPADSFHKALRKSMDAPAIQNQLRLHGLSASDIGAHSIRKGAATYLANGSTASPSYSSICIRLSWSMGVKDRYLHYNYAADAYCGRILAGLDQNSTKFATLPAHTLTPLDFILTQNSFPSTEQLPTLEPVRQFMVACLLHGSQAITTLLPGHHPVFQSYCFRNIAFLKETVAVVSGLSSPALSATGLPPHVLSWLNHLRIEDLVQQLPQKVFDGIGNVLQANGVAAGNITKELLESIMRNLLESDRQARSQPFPQASTDRSPRMFLWASDGRFHRLPEDYNFPDLTVPQAFLIWFEGNPSNELVPFRHLEMFDIPPPWRKRFSDLRCIIRLLLEQVPESQRHDLNQMSTQRLTSTCLQAISALPKKAKKKSTRTSQWMITTALREVREARVLMNPELKRTQRPPAKPSAPRTKRTRR